MITYADRTEKQKLNKFIELKNGIKGAAALPMLDLSIGEPPLNASLSTHQRLCTETFKAENRFYTDNGILKFAEISLKYFNLHSDPVDKNLISQPVLGSKSALSLIPAAFINPGDITIMPVPSYPVLEKWTEYMGGGVFKLPLLKEQKFYPDLNSIPVEVLEHSKLLYLNYPNNPTGQTADKNFLKNAVEFALKWDILIVYDSAYAEIVRPGVKALSIFSIPRAEKCCIEIFSLSKARNMTGWRIGYIIGSEYLLNPIQSVKSNTDSGQYAPIQLAACQALVETEVCTEMNRIYTSRLQRMTAILNNNGFDAEIPQGTFYLYVAVPDKFRGSLFSDANSFCRHLITELGIIAVPWETGHFRLSMTFPIKAEGDDWFFEEIERRFMEGR